jgi:hypothetical protein
MEEDEMDGACSTHGRNVKCIKNFWLENLKGREHLEGLDVDWVENIRMDVRDIGWEDVD